MTTCESISDSIVELESPVQMPDASGGQEVINGGVVKAGVRVLTMILLNIDEADGNEDDKPEEEEK